MPNTSKHHQTPLKKIILKLPCQKSPRHFWTPCFGLFGLLTLHKSHNPMFRDHLPACQPSRHLLVFEGRDEHTVGKNLRRLLNVSRMGGTCTGHADVKVDIAVRLAGVRIWMDLGCFPLQFSRFFQLFSQGFRCSTEAQIFFGLGDVWQFLSHQVAPEVHQLGRQRQGATGRRAVWILGVKASPRKLDVSSMNLTSLISRNYSKPFAKNRN